MCSQSSLALRSVGSGFPHPGLQRTVIAARPALSGWESFGDSELRVSCAASVAQILSFVGSEILAFLFSLLCGGLLPFGHISLLFTENAELRIPTRCRTLSTKDASSLLTQLSKAWHLAVLHVTPFVRAGFASVPEDIFKETVCP